MIGLDRQTDLIRLLGDTTRVRLLSLLAREELTVAALVRITRLSQSRVSTHLGKLKDGGFVRDRRDGAARYYALRDNDMPAQAQALWDVVRSTAHDPLLVQDAERLRDLLRRRGGTWADAMAGRMERHYSPGRTWEAALRGLLGLARLGSVLDIASGDCAIAELVAPRARAVTCLDISRTVLRAGRNRFAPRWSHVNFRRADMHALPFADESFDHVLMLACLGYATDPARALAEAARVLRPGGAFVAVTLGAHEHREVVARYDHVQLGFEPTELERLARLGGLDVELCEVTSRERRPPHFEVITLYAGK